MSEELVEQIARLICEWNDDNPDASLGGDKQNFLWMEVAETLVRPKIMPRIEAAKVEGVRLGIEAAAKRVYADARNARLPMLIERYGDEATQHASDLLDASEQAIRALDPKQIAGGGDAD